MNVYFARSLRGARKTGDRETYSAIARTIVSCGHTLTMNTEPLEREIGEEWDEFVYRRDLDWLDRSHCMIAEVSNPSHGVGYEFAYAKHVCKIPIFQVAEKDTHVSAMLRFAAPVFYYRYTDDMQDGIKTFLEGLDDEFTKLNRDEGRYSV